MTIYVWLAETEQSPPRYVKRQAHGDAVELTSEAHEARRFLSESQCAAWIERICFAETLVPRKHWFG